MKTFTSTSNGLYDRHNYKLVFGDGRSCMIEDYEQLRSAWFQLSATKQLSHVEVLDVQSE